MFTLPRMIEHLRIPLSLYVISSTIQETRIQRLRTQTFLKIEAEVSLKCPIALGQYAGHREYYGLQSIMDCIVL